MATGKNVPLAISLVKTQNEGQTITNFLAGIYFYSMSVVSCCKMTRDRFHLFLMQALMLLA